jgi:hypothetical protein
MDTRKFEYLEAIRESIELGDYEELKDYMEDIREKVKNDADFEEIFLEISSGKYQQVISIIDDLIYKEMQEEFQAIGEDDDNDEPDFSEEDLKNFSFELEFGEDQEEEEISFESFDEDGFYDKAEDDNY